jgi:hypothetical protein
VSGGREARLGPAAERRRDLATVRLVSDDDDRLAAVRDRGANVVDRRAGCEPFVRLSLDAEPVPELGAGLPRAQQRAREDGTGAQALAGQPLAQLACGRPPGRRQLPELVGLSRLGLGVADQHELHRAGAYEAAAIVPLVRSPAGRIAIVVGAVVILVGLFALLRRGDDEESGAETTTTATTAETTTTETTTTDTTTTAPTTTAATGPRRIGVVVTGGQVAGGVKQGEQVLLVVQADVSDEVHVHGYDLMRDVAPGAPAQIAFRATIPGGFEVELEDRKLRILELEVRP